MSNILIFGDSIAQGYYDKKGGWVDRLKKYFLKEEIEQGWEQSINVFNQSVSGDSTKEVLERFDKETPPRIWSDHETVFVFPIGTNDSIVINGKQKIPQKKFEENLISIINHASKYSNNIHFIGPLPVEEEKVTPMPWSTTEYYFNSKIDEYNKMMKSVCRKENVHFLDLYHDWIEKNYQELFFDGVHPNTHGHELLFNRIKSYLSEFL